MRSSFLRPVTFRKPSSSSAPISPVWNHPSRRAAVVAVWLFRYAMKTLLPLTKISPSSAIRMATPGSGVPDGADPDLVGGVQRCRSRGLGESVPLQHGEPDAAEEVAQTWAQRSAARDGVLDLATHRGAKLAVHEPVEHHVSGGEQCTRPAILLRLAPGDRRRRRASEDPAPAIGDGSLRSRVVDLFEDARHRQDEGGREAGEVGDQVLDV